MKKINFNKENITSHLIILLLVGVIAGYWLKTTFKPYLTSGPEDNEIKTVEQSYDFEAAKNKLEKQAEEATQTAPQQQDTEGSCG